MNHNFQDNLNPLLLESRDGKMMGSALVHPFQGIIFFFKLLG